VKKLDDYRKLQDFNLFDNLSKADLAPIARETTVLQFGKGNVVCEENSESESMFFIHSGSVSVSKQGVVLAVLKAGDYFGEMSLVTGSSRNATVITQEPATLFEISAEEFDRIFDRLPRAMYKLLVTYDARLRRHNDTVVEQFMKMKQQYEELESAHQRLLLSDKMASIGLLTAGIAHEINNPLFVIRGYLDVINESLRSGSIADGELADIIAKLDTASKSIAKLVSGIKTYVRIEKTDAVPIELNSAIQDSIDLVSFLYRQDGIDIESKLVAEGCMILGNLGLLQQVLMNLLSNARDAMEQSEQKLITVTTRDEDGQAIIEVSDTGHGIGPGKLKKIFRQGYTTKPVGKGSGMGLNLVRRIVQEMGGAIEVESRVSEGATFRLTFPVFKPSPGL
jgi:signal transduction histidine kinase